MKRIIALVFIVLLLPACSPDLLGSNVEELLIAPQPNELQGAAYETIKEHAGDTAVIITPDEGPHVGALTVDDGAFSGEKSLIAFYSDSNAGTGINLAIMRVGEQGLYIHSWIKGLGTDVHKVEFAQLQSGEPPYMLVSYSGVTAEESYLAIYRFDNTSNELLSVFAQDYKAMLLADIDGGNEQEIVFALPSTREGAMQMRIISFANGSPLELYHGSPSQSITDAKELSFSYGSSGSYIVIDGMNQHGNSLSDLIKFESGDAQTLVILKDMFTHDVPLLQSIDIDADGVVEQPALLNSPDGMDGNGYLLVGYYDIAGNQQSPKYIGIVNSRLAYLILIPPHWYNNIVFTQDQDGFTLLSKDTDERLFAITATEGTNVTEYAEGATSQVLLLGSFRLYLTTFGQLTDYELSFIKDGIQAMY